MQDETSSTYYTGGDAAAAASSAARQSTSAIPNKSAALVADFKIAFKYFLLNFANSAGEPLYKDAIRRLDLLQSKKVANDHNLQEAHCPDLPFLLLDLEHLAMDRWLPPSARARAEIGHDQAHSQTEDSASQVSEEEDTQMDSQSRRLNNPNRWCDMLLSCFYKQPLRFIGIAEDVVREIFLETVSPKDLEDYYASLGLSSAPGAEQDSEKLLESLTAGGSSSAEDEDSGIPEESQSSLIESAESGVEGGPGAATSSRPPIDRNKLALFQIELLSRAQPLRIRQLSADLVDTLIVVSGIVVQAYRHVHKASCLRLVCRECGRSVTVSLPLWREGAEIPHLCVTSSGPPDQRCPPDPWVIASDESSFCDVQTVKMQELPEHVPTGDMPRNILLNMANALCGRVIPGERVRVAGVFCTRQGSGGAKAAFRDNNRDDNRASAYIHVLGVEHLDIPGGVDNISRGSAGGKIWTTQQEQQFHLLARDPEIHKKILQSIAPSLIGMDDIKKSIACLMFGGSRKQLVDGTRIRGDLNILMLGDPSTAKSQILKFVESAAPLAIYTSGKGSSAAGLTAAVVRDANGNFALEGGAMVLADGGIVCIDEFDKMQDSDRVAIHEAMEQQTISMAKAGITTILSTRCAVLAAANPAFGSYDETKDATEQHDFETTILSRFDLIWLLRDEKNPERDQRMARHIFDLHMGGGGVGSSSATTAPAIPNLKEYIAYCRAVCNPHLSADAAKKLENFYVEVRDAVRQDPRRRRDQIPITIRQLESLVRISEALAKMSLSTQATEVHVEEAIRLFKLATVEASKSNATREALTQNEREEVQQAERFILSRLPINARAAKATILKELKQRGTEVSLAGRAIRALVQRGVLEERGDASVIRRATTEVLS